MSVAKVLVVGASQGVGLELVNALAERGIEVRALARHKVRAARSGITAIEGDALNPADVARALDGSDGVALTLGLATRNPLALLGGKGVTDPDICSKGAAVAIAEMKRRGVRRLVALSADGVGESGKDQALMAKIFAATLIRGPMQDKERMETAIRASGLDWTIVRPVGLNDKRASGRPFVSREGRSQSAFVPRADVAAVMADSFASDAHSRAAVTVSVRSG